ncbi:hypothetical protein N7925_28870 [Streptomyces sp. CA-278952]|nr:hypothetical protein [Streptomyces sp. CA-278952]WDG32060.1 hypothetical protein N7925_28870 [Streptomyces sp. CA-278952]
MAGTALRPVEDGDLPLFFAWMSDPELSPPARGEEIGEVLVTPHC